MVNAIFVWGVARAAGGRVLLRIEDHDRVRCRPEFESACLEDLAWLGFVPDEGLTPLLRQQDHNRRYARALARLVAADRVYACACSRREIGGERYDGACRTRGLVHAPGTRPSGPDRRRDRDRAWTSGSGRWSSGRPISAATSW